MIEAPVETIASTILYLIRSEYSCIQPPADVEPAKVKNIVQSLSLTISLKIFAAFPVSLEVKDIFDIESIIGRASKEVMSICSTAVDKKLDLLWPIIFFDI